MRVFTSIIFLVLTFAGGCQKSSNDFYSEGIKKVERKEYKAALADFTKAIELDSTNIDAFLERGRYGAYSSNYNQEMDLSKYINTISPRLVNSFIGLGMVKSIKKDYSGALINFEKAISLEPTNIQAYVLKVQMLIQLNEKSTAKTFIDSLPDNIKSEIMNNNSFGL